MRVPFRIVPGAVLSVIVAALLLWAGNVASAIATVIGMAIGQGIAEWGYWYYRRRQPRPLATGDGEGGR